MLDDEVRMIVEVLAHGGQIVVRLDSCTE